MATQATSAGLGRPRRGLSQRAIEEIWGYVFLSPWIVGFAIFTAGAMLFSLGLTFFKTDLLTGYHFTGLGNYSTLVSDPYFGKSLVVTALYTLGSVPLTLLLSLSIATLLNQPVPARGIWRTVYYLPSVISGVAVSILWSWMFQPQFGLINSALELIGIQGPGWIFSETWALPSFIIMSMWGVGGSMLIYLAGLQGIPSHLYEAAEIDGAGSWQRYLHITLPMLSPTIFFNLVMNIIGSFQVFTASFIMTKGGPGTATLTMVLYLYRASFEQFKFGYASAIAWALFLIVLLFTLLTLRSSAAWVYYEGQLRR
jgi:multiple sugar transport system permease protein